MMWMAVTAPLASCRRAMIVVAAIWTLHIQAFSPCQPKTHDQTIVKPQARRHHGDRFHHQQLDVVAKAEPEVPLAAKIEERPRFLMHWKGESVEGYSLKFRHDEFRSALQAILREEEEAHGHCADTTLTLSFSNALSLDANTTIAPTIKEQAYNQALQYVVFILKHPKNHLPTLDQIRRAATRCSLVHALYQIVATTTTTSNLEHYKDLCTIAMEGTDFSDMQNQSLQASWCVRVRHYDDLRHTAPTELPRYGHRRTRSVQREREALKAFAPLLKTFTGPVDLGKPACKIYVIDGVIPPFTHHNTSTTTSSVLTRCVAQGLRTSVLNPNTRICVTNTPLCPIASCLLCNIGQVRRSSTILDPYVGSGSILLAASLIERSSSTVGIEISHDGLVDRAKIIEDFKIRDNLTPPVALIHGDCTDPLVRRQALAVVNNEPFDCILTDPPYGIRESLVEQRPIDELLEMIRCDAAHGRPLLRQGGRLVVFLPQPGNVALTNVLPTEDQIATAGLRLELCIEQYLSDVLNRWLVSFVCVK